MGSIGRVDMRADGAISRLIICRWTRCHRRSPHSIFAGGDLSICSNVLRGYSITSSARSRIDCGIMSPTRANIGPLDVRDYLEAAKANGLSTATLKQHMAAIRMLFDHLVTGGVLEHNPALSVKAPRASALAERRLPSIVLRSDRPRSAMRQPQHCYNTRGRLSPNAKSDIVIAGKKGRLRTSGRIP